MVRELSRQRVPMPKRYANGFTLVELMVTVAIVAILLAVALPSFQSSFRSNRVATTTNELLASLSLARSEALRNTRGAAVCTSANGTACGGGWNNGWLVWRDNDGDGTVDAGEPVIRYSQAKTALAIAGTATVLAFDSRGRTVGGQQTLDIRPSDATTPARCLTISVTGQTRVARTAC
jgi:type IV fimbrial biogenesis protein FimT